MIKIIKRQYPLEEEGKVNRLKSELAQATGATESAPFAAEQTYQNGETISHAGRFYIASTTIIAGETVIPGNNVTETSIESIINALNAKEE